MNPETEKKHHILDAALEVFLRYGFKKSTMGDIADKAGMSRPSLYLVYSNKEEIFRAVITRMEEEVLRESEENLANCSGVKEGIAAVLDTWIFKSFEMIRTSPEADELLDFAYSFAPDLRKKMLEAMEKQLLQALQFAPSRKSTRNTVADESIARLIAISTVDMKRKVNDSAELRDLLTTTVEVFASYVEREG
ncbi:MAG: TetR/AcrR family transcriptional regulator [Puniceicoccales bacterium]